ncbi:MAG: 30S ribosomal protein S9 [Candidatus Zambryskibacteria bacterium]|nr:30S ribosomal protein S9 [Candidatus Zambryskibacteria bacterium]
MEHKIEPRYIEAVGRRKTSVARVRITPSSKTTFAINNKELGKYFPTKEMQIIVEQPFFAVSDKFKVSAHIFGGGIHSQSEALRHGIARALTLYQGDLRKTLKKAGYLKRDPRAKERRKFGLKKARKAPQWSKR